MVCRTTAVLFDLPTDLLRLFSDFILTNRIIRVDVNKNISTEVLFIYVAGPMNQLTVLTNYQTTLTRDTQPDDP